MKRCLPLIVTSLLLASCIQLQPLTLDDTYEPAPDLLPLENKQTFVLLSKRFKKEQDRTVLYTRGSMSGTSGWYSCDNAIIEIRSSAKGICAEMKRAVYECFTYNFPATDLQKHPILHLRAFFLPAKQHISADLTLMLIDELQHKSDLYPSPVYIAAGNSPQSYFIDLREHLLKEPALNPAKVNRIRFYINTIEKEPFSGELIITDLELLDEAKYAQFRKNGQ